ncbi:MAG: hypothetical protein Q4A66_09260, partial [Eubacteriales bacterium]|nr:hypothetical protein [Eubacteriales bacterium]
MRSHDKLNATNLIFYGGKQLQSILKQSKALYKLEDYSCSQMPGHDGGRNLIYICSKDENKYVLRISV